VKSKRLRTVAERISRFPYRYEAIDDAYAQFLADGTLPDDDALASRVLKRVLHARKPLPPDPDDLLQTASRPLSQPYGSTREMVFREACCTVKPARDLARDLLKAVVQAGYDPTDPEIIQPELEPADFASIAMQLLGWPREYVRPEYLPQLDRVLQQLAAERANRPRNDAEWTAGAGAALSAFMTQGVVPAEPRYFAFVIPTCEQFALHGHYFGRGGKELLAAFDAVATGTAEARAAALQRLGPLQVHATEALGR
jgi:hypothetical protein